MIASPLTYSPFSRLHPSHASLTAVGDLRTLSIVHQSFTQGCVGWSDMCIAAAPLFFGGLRATWQDNHPLSTQPPALHICHLLPTPTYPTENSSGRGGDCRDTEAHGCHRDDRRGAAHGAPRGILFGAAVAPLGLSAAPGQRREGGWKGGGISCSKPSRRWSSPRAHLGRRLIVGHLPGWAPD